MLYIVSLWWRDGAQLQCPPNGGGQKPTVQILTLVVICQCGSISPQKLNKATKTIFFQNQVRLDITDTRVFKIRNRLLIHAQLFPFFSSVFISVII